MNRERIEEIVKDYGTPAYVFDLDMLRERVRMIKECMGEKADICFAMKANPFLIQPLSGIVDCYEVCSPGEFHICEKARIPMEQIVLSGVNKEWKDIDYVLETYGGKGMYTIESRLHLQILEECAAKRNVVIRALVRVTSGNQFGLDEGEVLDILSHRTEYPHIEFQGIQCYSGTQKKKFAKIQKELDWLDELIIRIEQKTGFQICHLEYGPGFYVPYFESDEEIDDRELLGWFRERLEAMQFNGQITLEMGRYIAAYCGYYLTRIVDKKVNRGQNYCIVDGGIHHLNYYGQTMAMRIPHYKQMKTGKAQREEVWNVCGSLCTVNDVLVKQLPLQSPELGDVLIFKRVGAYSVTEGICLFLSRDLPAVIFWDEETGSRLIRGKQGIYGINSVG